MSDLTGQIGLVPHPKSLVEWLIEKVTRSNVHHAILAISPTSCISCEPAGALVRHISDFPDAYWSHFDLGQAQKLAIARWGLDHRGVPYGWFTDAAIGISLLFHERTPKWVERYLNSGRFYCCSQFCDAAYDANGIHLFRDGRLPGTVYPGSLAHVWRAHGWMS